MKYTLRLVIFTLCLLTSISAFADRRGADLFKPANNRTSPSQWNNSRSGNNFSYSRTNGYYGSSSSSLYGQRSVYGTTANQTTTLGGTGTTLSSTTNDTWLSGDSEDGFNGPQHLRGAGSAIDLRSTNDTGIGPLSDALPCLGVLLLAFTLYKSRRKIYSLLTRRN